MNLDNTSNTALPGRESFDPKTNLAPLVHSAPQETPQSHWRNLLQGVAEATKVLLTGSDRIQAINQALAVLGQVTGVDWVYIFEYHPHPVTTEPAMSQRFEWIRSGLPSQLTNPLLRDFCHTQHELADWHERLTSGCSVSMLRSNLAGQPRKLFELLGIHSALLVPIPVEGQTWGCLGFSDCHRERQWSQDEEAALMTMAASLGGIMTYRQIVEALKHERQQTQVQFLQSQLQLAESEERFRLMVEGSEQVFFYVHDPDYTLQYISPSVLNVLGYTSEELTGQSCDIIISNISMQLAHKLTDRALLTGECEATYAIAADHKDGREVVMEIIESPLVRDGQVIGVQGFARDITDRHNALKQLQAIANRDRLLGEMAQRIRQSLDLKQILKTTVAEVREFLQADRVFIFRIDEGQVEGKVHAQFQIFAESVVPGLATIEGFVIEDEVYIQEMKTLFRQGISQIIRDVSQIQLTQVRAQYFTQCQVKASLAVPILLVDRLFGVLVVHQCDRPRDWQPIEVDLIEKLGTQVAIAIQQANLYEELQRLNMGLEQQVEARTQELGQKYAELQELQKLKDEFLHAFSHDLRTPVMGSLLVLKNFQKRSPGESATISPSVLERMIQSGERQLSLINSLLEAHSSETRGITLNYEPLHLHDLADEIIDDLEPLLTKNQAVLSNRMTRNLPLVMADPLHLRRVFENLLTNALNHNLPGLHLTLDALLQEDAVCCTIQDNGVGIAPQLIQRLFDRYIRGSRSRSTGIGLGLYLCRQIITAHGGQIGVSSQPGSGATFWFTLPIVQLIPEESTMS